MDTMEGKMKYKYKHIKFVYSRSWCCETKDGDSLGEVHWYPPHRQYCFFPDEGTVFSADYLADIQDFLRRTKSLRIPKEIDSEQD